MADEDITKYILRTKESWLIDGKLEDETVDDWIHDMWGC